MAIPLNADGKIDETTKIKDEILDERRFRSNILAIARERGCLREAILIFKKYDDLMRCCNNEYERKDIGKLGIIEMHKLFGGGPLTIDGAVVFKE